MSEMTVREAGRKGGLKTKKNHDRNFFKEIGKKGGMANARKLIEEGVSEDLHDMLSEAGKKGGEKTKKTYGKDFYASIGRKGGKSKGVDSESENT